VGVVALALLQLECLLLPMAHPLHIAFALHCGFTSFRFHVKIWMVPRRVFKGGVQLVCAEPNFWRQNENLKPMPREIITVQVGQCGNRVNHFTYQFTFVKSTFFFFQLGSQVWSQIASEHGIDK
jgi:hypothetical protein